MFISEVAVNSQKTSYLEELDASIFNFFIERNLWELDTLG